jgi:hypothetical protein
MTNKKTLLPLSDLQRSELNATLQIQKENLKELKLRMHHESKDLSHAECRYLTADIEGCKRSIFKTLKKLHPTPLKINGH